MRAVVVDQSEEHSRVAWFEEHQVEAVVHGEAKHRWSVAPQRSREDAVIDGDTLRARHRMTREPELPTFLGRYAVVRRLGAGGMAEVFLARSRGAEGVDKQLVVKRILPAYAENPHFRAMFIEEARVALRLNHPNVVQVYGFESDGATLLLIMEHVDGPDLGFLVAAARGAQ